MGGHALNAQDNREGLRALPLNPMECGIFRPLRGPRPGHAFVSLQGIKM